MFIGMLLVHFCITIRIISTTLAFVQFPADNLNPGQSNCRFSNHYHGNNDIICINFLCVCLLICVLTLQFFHGWLLFCLYLEKNNYPFAMAESRQGSVKWKRKHLGWESCAGSCCQASEVGQHFWPWWWFWIFSTTVCTISRSSSWCTASRFVRKWMWKMQCKKPVQ